MGLFEATARDPLRAPDWRWRLARGGGLLAGRPDWWVSAAGASTAGGLPAGTMRPNASWPPACRPWPRRTR